MPYTSYFSNSNTQFYTDYFKSDGSCVAASEKIISSHTCLNKDIYNQMRFDDLYFNHRSWSCTILFVTGGGRIILSDSGGVRRNVIVVQKTMSTDRPVALTDSAAVTTKASTAFEKVCSVYALLRLFTFLLLLKTKKKNGIMISKI